MFPSKLSKGNVQENKRKLISFPYWFFPLDVAVLANHSPKSPIADVRSLMKIKRTRNDQQVSIIKFNPNVHFKFKRSDFTKNQILLIESAK